MPSTVLSPPVENRPPKRKAAANVRPRCVYCGQTIRAGYACAAHSDLPQLDVALRLR